MWAMTSNNDIRTREGIQIRESLTESEESYRSMPLPAGLSALIQAATSQLSCLAEASTILDESSRRVVTMTHSEDTISSDDEDATEQTDTPARTPTMVPEIDTRKQLFPETLMTLALDPTNIDVIAFLPDGKFFAIRTKDFSEKLMVDHFALATFVEFIDVLHAWGFTRIRKESDCSGIEVFRHPLFIKDDWDRCSQIKFRNSPTDVRASVFQGVRIDHSAFDELAVVGNSHTKRRLSPGFLARRESETSVSSQKQRVDLTDLSCRSGASRRGSNASEASERLPTPTCYTNVNRTDDLRSIALSITTEKLNIRSDYERESSESPLIERAVQSATHTIVTDAIETLLRDQGHTMETYRKHEQELSRSSLPGVVPISTQLFAQRSNYDRETHPPRVLLPATKPPGNQRYITKIEKHDAADHDVKPSATSS